MEKNDLIKNLKKFAEAHGITTDIDNFMQHVPAGDFIVLSSAIEDNDTATIIDILNSYNATQYESYNYFKMCYSKNNDYIMEFVNLAGNNGLTKYINKFCKHRVFDESRYTTAMLKTLVYEDLQSSANSSLDGSTDNTSQSTNDQQSNNTDYSSLPSNDTTPDVDQLINMKVNMLTNKIDNGQNLQTNDGQLLGFDQDSGMGVVKDNDGIELENPADIDVDGDDDLTWLDNAIKTMDRR